jgi:hypothetical protein
MFMAATRCVVGKGDRFASGQTGGTIIGDLNKLPLHYGICKGEGCKEKVNARGSA